MNKQTEGVSANSETAADIINRITNGINDSTFKHILVVGQEKQMLKTRLPRLYSAQT
ncbi:hypothetical protein [Collimonas humicola]|uniref:hypothetical protein n=1 Tax=Collimonas humicola TaxID=2825886 RepID=UPI001B8D8AF7|nr:hypothetical protein [Collimonas humicola]